MFMAVKIRFIFFRDQHLDADPEEQCSAYDLEPRQPEQIDGKESQNNAQNDGAEAAKQDRLFLLLGRQRTAR